MRSRRLALLALSALLAAPAFAQDTDPFMRHPAVHPDGDRIAVAYQGDLWTAPVDGDTPERLTIHEAYEGHQRGAPDGSRIAFTTDRDGNSDPDVTTAARPSQERHTDPTQHDTPNRRTP